MKIDINKKYRTRDAKWPVTIVSVDGPYPGFPVVGYTHPSSNPLLSHWSADGSYPANTCLDLIEVREPREYELVVSTPQNSRFKTGEIDGAATDDLQRGIRDVSANAWEIIRVREIIE